MFYSITLPNERYGDLMPVEDAFAVRGRAFCVADGITRDPKLPKNFSQKITIENVLPYYPNPSGATMAAETFCSTFTKILKRGSIDSVRMAFQVANKNIAKLNKKFVPRPDYLVNDLFGCVASGGIIADNKLFWGAITDCGVIVFNKHGRKKFQTPNWMKPFETFVAHSPGNWLDPKRRVYIRREFRNRTDQIQNGRCVAYGALTGERSAKKFMHFGQQLLIKGDIVIFYTDGFEHALKDKRFFKNIYQSSPAKIKKVFLPFAKGLAELDYEKFGHERTLVAYIHD